MKPFPDKTTPVNNNESSPNSIVTYDAIPRKKMTLDTIPVILFIVIILSYFRKTYIILLQNTHIPILISGSSYILDKMHE
jgi:hypothetical protein